MATGCLSSANIPDFPGRRPLRGRDVPHRPVAARGCRLHRQARRRDRHRLVGDPVDPDHRRQARRAHRVPAHRELLGARRTTARSTRRRSARSRPTTPAFRARNSLMPTAIGSRLPVDRERRRSRSTPDERERVYESALGARRPAVPRRVHRSALRSRTRTRPRPSSCAPRSARSSKDPAVAERCRRRPSSAASGCASTPATSRRSTATTSSSST